MSEALDRGMTVFGTCRVQLRITALGKEGLVEPPLALGRRR